MATKWPLVPAAALAVMAMGCGDPNGPGRPTHPAGVIYASRPLSAGPYGVAISSSGKVYVARLGVDSVSFATLPDTVFQGSVPVGVVPSHVAFDPSGTFAYVANQGSHSVSIIDTRIPATIASVPTATDAWNVIVSRNGATLYATTDQGMLYFINTITRIKEDSLLLAAGDALRGLALNSNGSRLYVAGRNSGRVYEIQTSTRSVVDTLVLTGILQRMAVSPSNDELYVANESRGLDIVTLSTGTFTTIQLGAGGYGLALSPDGAQLYVTVPDSAYVKVLDRGSRTVVNTLRLGGRTRNVAFSARGDYAVVTTETGAVHFIR